MRIVFAALALSLAMGLAAVDAEAQRSRHFDPAATYNVAQGDGPTRGEADAPITIVEFSDFGCPYCGRAQATLKKLMRLYPGRVRLVYRHMPLDLEEGTLAAEAAEAARAQGQFWAMHDRLFAARGAVNRELVEGFARELGLDVVRFRQDLDSGRHIETIRRDAAAAGEIGVFSTPYFFVNGRPVRGAQPLGVFVDMVEQEIERAEEMIAAGVAPADVYDKVVSDGRAKGEPPSGDNPAYRDTSLDTGGTYRVGLGQASHVLGKPDALVTIVEFSDFECPYCLRLLPAIGAVLEAYPDDVRVVFRHLPLSFHSRAQLAAEAAVAAGAQGKFWEYHHALFSAQDHLDRASLEARAEGLGLDMEAFRAALDDRRYYDVVAGDAAAGNALGVTGTPTVFVNGQPIEGAVPPDYLKMVVQDKLEQARAMVARGVEREDVYAVIMNAANATEVGDETRMPIAASIGAIELEQDDYDTAARAACRARDGERAEALYDKLGDDAKDRVRVDCQSYGVDLPPAR